ncbi:MAG: PfkB family carbohydrate kinase [Planctomycetota bacterium]
MAEPQGRSTPGGILSRESILAWRRGMRSAGRRLVQCHGCFDIVHPGHVRHLRWAREQGDALLVTLTGDRDVAKGVGRPLIPEHLRAENLAALDMVDAVHIVREPTAQAILEAVQPDVYVKGREYETNNDPRFAAERAAVEASGGRVVFSSGDVVFSSSALIAALGSELNTGLDAASRALGALVRHPALPAGRLSGVIDAAQGARVLVVGEALSEVYRLCEAPRVGSREPVMTLRPAEERRFDGGSAGVARHLAAMGLGVTLLTCPPAGEPGVQLRERLAAAGVEVEALADGGPPLVVEHYLAGTQKLTTIDHCRPMALDASLRDALVDRVQALAADRAAVVIADFGLGMLPAPVMHRLSAALHERRCALAAAAPGVAASLLGVRGADLLCASEAELRRAVGNPAGSLTAAAWTAMESARAHAAVVGLGAEGLLAFDRLPEPHSTGDGWPTRVQAQPVPSLAPMPLDATGADAAILAAAMLAVVGGRARGDDRALEPITAAVFGAMAEAAALQRPGYAAVSAVDLRESVVRLHDAHLVYHEPSPLVHTAPDAAAARAAS